MSSRRDHAVSQPSEVSSAEDLETAAILAKADRDCDAGLGLRGQDAATFLRRVLDDARARVALAKRD
ncbi:hypothetical protein [Caulobacter sp. Root655]|uniref:hypothetical protein n=1 Tax=Caulobacter sp. Root655 TaxID=1736578 RepID=UPI000A9A4D9C|nr:hypothetical protein [Caulobacter sp. Root655]